MLKPLTTKKNKQEKIRLFYAGPREAVEADYDSFRRLLWPQALVKRLNLIGGKWPLFEEAEVLPVSLVPISKEVVGLCAQQDLAEAGVPSICPGFQQKLVCCPPQVPGYDFAKKLLAQASAILIIKSKKLTQINDYRAFYNIAYITEAWLKKYKYTALASWSSYSCCLCDDCQLQKNCCKPQHMRNSLASMGVDTELMLQYLATAIDRIKWKKELFSECYIDNNNPVASRALWCFVIKPV